MLVWLAKKKRKTLLSKRSVNAYFFQWLACPSRNKMTGPCFGGKVATKLFACTMKISCISCYHCWLSPLQHQEHHQFLQSSTLLLLFLLLFLQFTVLLALLLLFLLFWFAGMNKNRSTGTFIYPICNIMIESFKQAQEAIQQSTQIDCIVNNTFWPPLKPQQINYLLKLIIGIGGMAHGDVPWHLAITFRGLHEHAHCIYLICLPQLFFKLNVYIEILYIASKLPWQKYSDIPSNAIYNMDELSNNTTKDHNKII